MILYGVELFVLAVQGEQFLVGTVFDDVAVLDYDYPISIFDCR
jgi:hypothetical protein